MSVLGPDSRFFKKEPSKRGQWLVHHPYTLPWMVLVVTSTQEIINRSDGPIVWVSVALAQVVNLTLIFEMVAGAKHLRGFCEFCFHQPAGGPAVAEKHRRRLRIHHLRYSSNRWLYIALVLITFIPVIFLHHWYYVAYISAFWFLFGYSDKSSQIHAWLVPWCPWCKDDGRWTEPSPTPDPSMTKQHT